MIWSGVAALVLRGPAGYGNARLMPHRVLPGLTVSGLSVVLAPLCAGLAMLVFGRWRRPP